MRPLSAIDAISPAWQHTRNLFAPRPWRTVLKIALVAFCANMGSGFNGNFRGNSMRHVHGLPSGLSAAILIVIVLFGLFALALSALFFYLASRFQFVFFEVVLRNDTKVAPIWNRYGSVTWRWIGLKLLLILFSLILLLPVLVPFLFAIFHIVKEPGFQPHFWPLFKMFLGFFVAFFAIGLVITAAFRLLIDFGLPSMALEGTSISETVKRIFRLIASEPGPILFYLFIYLVLSLVILVAYLVALVLTVVVALIPLGGLGVALWFGLHKAGTAGYIVIGVGAAILGLILVAVIVLAILVFLAYALTFKQAYALYFLGGRYPLLGAYLEPPTPQFTYEPPPPTVYPPPPIDPEPGF